FAGCTISNPSAAWPSLGGDAPQRLVFAKELRQVPARLLPDLQRRGFYVRPGQDVLLEELAQQHPLRGFE
ncbi:MAG: hypothetical protein SNJ75_20000, partial [Gemmataceae bacterium]